MHAGAPDSHEFEVEGPDDQQPGGRSRGPLPEDFEAGYTDDDDDEFFELDDEDESYDGGYYDAHEAGGYDTADPYGTGACEARGGIRGGTAAQGKQKMSEPGLAHLLTPSSLVSLSAAAADPNMSRASASDLRI